MSNNYSDCIKVMELKKDLEPLVKQDKLDYDSIKTVLQKYNIDFPNSSWTNINQECNSVVVQSAINNISFDERCRKGMENYATKYCNDAFSTPEKLQNANNDIAQLANKLFPDASLAAVRNKFGKPFKDINDCIDRKKQPIINNITQENKSKVEQSCKLVNLINSEAIKDKSLKTALQIILGTPDISQQGITTPSADTEQEFCNRFNLSNRNTFDIYQSCLNTAMTEQSNILNVCGMYNEDIVQKNNVSSSQKCELTAREEPMVTGTPGPRTTRPPQSQNTQPPPLPQATTEPPKEGLTEQQKIFIGVGVAIFSSSLLFIIIIIIILITKK